MFCTELTVYHLVQSTMLKRQMFCILYKETCCYKVLLLKKIFIHIAQKNCILAVFTNIRPDYRFEFLKSSLLRSHSMLLSVTNSSVASSWNSFQWLGCVPNSHCKTKDFEYRCTHQMGASDCCSKTNRWFLSKQLISHFLDEKILFRQ